MAWTDKQVVRTIKYLRDKYKIKTFVETGTYKGDSAMFYSKNFKCVMTCEKVNAYYNIAKERIDNYKKLKYHRQNIVLINEDSPEFLRKLSLGQYIFYLDAHFYDPQASHSDRFVVLKELDNMKKFKNSVIIIHDFNNGLGGICYDGVDLDMDLVRSRLKKINRNFHFYANTLKSVDPVKPTAKDIIECGMPVDFETLDTLNHVWSTPERTYRGLLYCLPTKLSPKEIKLLGLRECK